MNQDNFLWGLQITDGLTMELVSKMTVIAFGVGVICFICNMAYNYLYHGASQLLTPNEDKFPDMMEIARCLVEKPLNFDPFGHARFAHLFVLYD